MRWPLAAILAFALSLIGCSSALAVTRYVAIGGTDSLNDCTAIAAPCRHIQYAANLGIGGDTIQIGPGIFEESVEADVAQTFVGAGAGTTEDASGATIVEPPAESKEFAFALKRGGALRSLRATGGSGAGGFPSGEPGGPGVVYVPTGPGKTALEVESALISGGSGESFSGGASAVVVSDAATADPLSVEVVDSNLAGSATFGGGAPGLRVSGGLASGSVADSRVFGGGLFGVGVEATEGAAVAMRTSEVGGGVGAISRGGHLDIARSTVRGFIDGVEALQSGGLGGDVRLTDSLVEGTGPGGSARAYAEAGGGAARVTADGVTFVSQGTSAAVIAQRPSAAAEAEVLMRNSIARHMPPAETEEVDLLASGGTIDADFSSFSTSAAEEGGSAPAPGSASNVVGDPQFVEPKPETPAEPDFRLRPSSPLIDRGDPAVAAPGELDLAGAQRSLDGNGDCVAAPDIGAYELTGHEAACPPGPVPPPTVAPPPPPRPAPAVSHFRLVPKAFALKQRRGRKHAKRRAARFVFTLSTPARVVIAIERKRRRGGRRHRGPGAGTSRHRPKRRTAFVRVGALRGRARPGRNSIRFSGRLHGKPLQPGRYRATIVATDSSARKSAPRRTRFRVLPG